MTTQIRVLFPMGRLVQGSLSVAQDKDQDGKPLLVKSGPNMGKPTVKYFFAVAIEKTPGHTHWASTEWGAKIWTLGHTLWPQGQAKAPTFAWKVEDGDSEIPNTKGKKNKDRPGFAGHWVVNFSSGYAPRVFNSNGSQALDEAAIKAIKLGFFVQVEGTVDSNRSDQKPGMYINHSLVAFQGYGPEIIVGPDAAAVGFGSGPVPTGMTAAPVGGMSAAPPPPAPTAPAPAAPPPPAPVAAAPAPAAPPAVAVVPQPSMIAPPPPVAPPAASTSPVLTAKANGATYEAMVAAGWTDATLRQHGYLT
jgi:hypothetical protein